MKLKYHEDITWEDLPKIERTSLSRFALRDDLSRPRQRLQIGHLNDPFHEVYNAGSKRLDRQALNRLYVKMEEGKVLLVHNNADDIFFNAFEWTIDDSHPDNGYWSPCIHTLSNAQYHINLLLQRVKKPVQTGSIKASPTVTGEYGYIPSSQGTSVAEGTVTEAAKIIGKFLYQVGSKTVILSTLIPGTAGGSTTYDIPNEPDLRIYESPTTPPQYQRRVDGEWQATGIRAKEVIADNRVQGYEALSPEDMESLKSTGGIPIPPQDKPTIEGSPPDNPPDSSRLEFPGNQGQLDNKSMPFPSESNVPTSNTGFNKGTDVSDVAGSSVMYNQSGDTGISKASDLPVVKPRTPEWKNAVNSISGLGKGKLNIRTETSTDAKALLKEARGNMDRHKNYTSQSYRKGYEIHNTQNPRELGAGNDLQHLKWKDGKSGGHIYYDKAR